MTKLPLSFLLSKIRLETTLSFVCSLSINQPRMYKSITANDKSNRNPKPRKKVITRTYNKNGYNFNFIEDLTLKIRFYKSKSKILFQILMLSFLHQVEVHTSLIFHLLELIFARFSEQLGARGKSCAIIISI